MRKLLYILICLTVLFSCRRNSTQYYDLALAEKLVDSFPDSALAVLERVAPAGLGSRELEARRALIAAYAQYHSNTDIDSASLAVASGFYTLRAHPFEYALSRFLKGEVDYVGGHNINALIHLYDSYDAFNSLGDHFWTAMAARDIARVYNNMRFFNEDLKYSLLSYDAFMQSGRQPYLDYAIMGLGIAHLNNHQYSEAQPFLRQAIDSAEIHNNAPVLAEASLSLAMTLYAQDKYADALDIYKNMCRLNMMTAQDSAFMSLCFLSMGNDEMAYQILDDIKEKEQNFSKDIAVKFYEKQGNYSAAFKLQEEINDDMDTFLTNLTQMEAADFIARHYIGVAKHKEIERKAAQTRYTLVAVAATAVIAFLVLLIYYLQRMSRQRLNDKIRFIEDLQTMCNINEDNISTLQHSVRDLMKERYDSFNRLHSIMNENPDGKISQKRFAEVVNRVLFSIAPGGSDYNQLEAWVNEHHDNIMTHLKEDLPDLKASDYALFLFTIIGFSIPSIANLLGVENITSIYNRKRRLKNKISQLTTERKDLYLDVLS